MSEGSKWICGCETCREHPRRAEAKQHRRLNRVVSALDEKQARRVLGLLAGMAGHGGVAHLSRVTGMSRATILRGKKELVGIDPVPEGRVRRVGGGRKPLEKKDRA